MSRARQMQLLRPLVFERAAGRCEAGKGNRRCPFRADELQHALPRARARAGDEHILDRAAVRAFDDGTFDPDRHLDHLLALCRRCHGFATANSDWAKTLRLVIPGSVTTGLDGTPIYVGSDERMRTLWPDPNDELRRAS